MVDKTEEQEVEEVPTPEEQEPSAEEVNEAEPEPSEEAATPETDVKQVEDQLIRLRADFDNFRKRTQREKEQWSALALEGVMSDLLMVLDHFELGLKNAEEHEAKPAVAEGFRLVYDQMAQCLKKHKLEEIEAEGGAFNPEVHEAISTMPSEEIENDHIAVVARRGYTLGSKVLRPAQVVVSSGSAATENEPKESEA